MGREAGKNEARDQQAQAKGGQDRPPPSLRSLRDRADEAHEVAGLLDGIMSSLPGRKTVSEPVDSSIAPAYGGGRCVVAFFALRPPVAVEDENVVQVGRKLPSILVHRIGRNVDRGRDVSGAMLRRHARVDQQDLSVVVDPHLQLGGVDDVDVAEVVSACQRRADKPSG